NSFSLSYNSYGFEFAHRTLFVFRVNIYFPPRAFPLSEIALSYVPFHSQRVTHMFIFLTAYINAF
ncbi:hypothetical protein L9F63_018630, partial [Diploptera punctata]